jgi:hypothetical protein
VRHPARGTLGFDVASQNNPARSDERHRTPGGGGAVPGADEAPSEAEPSNPLVSSGDELDSALAKGEVVGETPRDRRQGEAFRGQEQLHAAFRIYEVIEEPEESFSSKSAASTPSFTTTAAASDKPSRHQARRSALWVGPIVAAYLLGYTGDVGRFPSAGHYARYNATAPIEASSGPIVRHRLNPRGNRQLNHAIHMIAVTQISNDTPGRVYYLRKQAEGRSRKEAMRALKRRISDTVYRQLVLDTRH